METFKKPGTFDSSVQSYHWKHNEQITDALSGTNGVADHPRTVEDARELVKERFGCVIQSLPEEFQRDRELLLEATVRSGGHILPRIPETVRSALTADFFLSALWDGAPWHILRHAPEQIRANPIVVEAFLMRDGHALKYAADACRSDPKFQRIAVEQNPTSIAFAIDPSDEVKELAKKKNGVNGNGNGNGNGGKRSLVGA